MKIRSALNFIFQIIICFSSNISLAKDKDNLCQEFRSDSLFKISLASNSDAFSFVGHISSSLSKNIEKDETKLLEKKWVAISWRVDTNDRFEFLDIIGQGLLTSKKDILVVLNEKNSDIIHNGKAYLRYLTGNYQERHALLFLPSDSVDLKTLSLEGEHSKNFFPRIENVLSKEGFIVFPEILGKRSQVSSDATLARCSCSGFFGSTICCEQGCGEKKCVPGISPFACICEGGSSPSGCRENRSCSSKTWCSCGT